jgi:hypothetical protein
VEHNSSSQSRLIIILKKNKKLAAEDDVGSPPDTFWQKTIIRFDPQAHEAHEMQCKSGNKKYSEELC